MNKLLKLVSIIILALVLISGLVMAGCTASPVSVEVGDPAPNFRFQNSEGEYISLSDLRGKPVLIGFWQVRCPACWSEMPYIQQLYDEWTEKGLVLMMVNDGESPSMVEGFMQDANFTFPVLLDREGELADKYDILFLPTKFFIDKDGIIQDKKIGASQSKADIEQHLSKIIP